MQEIDAERRIQTLRGLQVDSAVEAPKDLVPRAERPKRVSGVDKDRKKRRIDGENDTERDMRYAKENQSLLHADKRDQHKQHKTSNAPLTDRAGHINLFPVEGKLRQGPKNLEAEAEAAAKKKDYSDQYTMRFSNAAGFKQTIGETPWYHNSPSSRVEDEKNPGKDVWEKEDYRRKERQKARITADDPLAMIQKGVQDLRQVEKQRQEWIAERKQDTEALKREVRRRERKKRPASDNEELEGFTLNDIEKQQGKKRHEHKGSRQQDGSHDRNHRSRRNRPQSEERSIDRRIDKSRRRTRNCSSERDPQNIQSFRKDQNVDQESHHKERHKMKEVAGWKAGPGGRYSSQFAGIQS